MATECIELAKCPGGTQHAPAAIEMDGYAWVECPQCGRESYAVRSIGQAVFGWNSDVGMPGRSMLIAGLKSTATSKFTATN